MSIFTLVFGERTHPKDTYLHELPREQAHQKPSISTWCREGKGCHEGGKRHRVFVLVQDFIELVSRRGKEQVRIQCDQGSQQQRRRQGRGFGG